MNKALAKEQAEFDWISSALWATNGDRRKSRQVLIERASELNDRFQDIWSAHPPEEWDDAFNYLAISRGLEYQRRTHPSVIVCDPELEVTIIRGES